MLKQLFFIFFKKKALFLPHIIAFSVFFLYQIAYCIISKDSSFIYFEKDVLKISELFSILFLYTAFEFFSLDERVNLRECIESSGKLKKYTANQFLVMLVLASIYSITAFAFLSTTYAINFNNEHLSYLIRIFLDVFLNIFLVLFSTIIISLSISLTFKRFSAFIVLFAVTILRSSLFLNLLSGSNVCKLLDLFNFNIYLDFMPNHSFGFSLLPYRWIKHIIGIIICLLIYLIGNKKLTKKIKSAASLSFIIMLSCSIFLYYLPSSKVDMSEYSQIQELKYYENVEQKHSASNFDIKKCKMDLNIVKQLHAKVTVDVTNQTLEEYNFTLYHGYKIKKIVDQNLNSLNYTQLGDYIVIYNKEKSIIKQIIFYYSGSCPTFYSNYQGTYLSGAFPYYPKAGYHYIYSKEYQSYEYVLPKNKIIFEINVDSNNKKIYSNIPTNQNGCFEGESYAATIVSGLYEETIVNGIRIVYPYLAKELITEDALCRETANILNWTYYKEDTIKTIISIPNMNNYGYNPDYSGCIETVGIGNVSDVYKLSVVPENKRFLYLAFQFYDKYGQMGDDIPEEYQEIINKIEKIKLKDSNAINNIQDYIFLNKNSQKYDVIFGFTQQEE